MNSQVIVYASKEDVQGLRDVWNRLQWHPEFDFDYYLQTLETDARLKPCVLGLHENGEITGLLAGTIKRMPVELRFGYKLFPSPTFDIFVLNRGAVLGEMTAPASTILFSKAVELLEDRAFDILFLGDFPVDDPFHNLALSKASFFTRDHFRIQQEDWLITIPSSIDEYLSKHKNLRTYHKGYYANKLARRYGATASIICYSSPEQLDTILEDTDKIFAHTWQRNMGAASFLTENTIRQYKFYLRKGWLQVYILYLDGTPACFLHGVKYKGVFYVTHMGYNPAYKDYRIGNYLFVNVVHVLCDSGDTRMLDFGVGNSEAKSTFCDTYQFVEDVYLFGPAIHLKTINLLRALLTATHLTGKYLLKRSGWFEKLRKQWRHSN